MISQLFKRPDRPTALRLRRQLMAMYSYSLIWTGIYVGINLGIFDPEIPLWEIFITLYSVNAIIYFSIRSGVSQLVKDPSLTATQMMVAIIAVTFVLHYTTDIRGAMMSIYFMIMTFGVFALDRVKMMMMSVFISVSFSVLILYEWNTNSQSQIFGISFGQWMILVLGLSWFVYVGGYIYNLQQRIRDQRETLRDNEQRLTQAYDDLTITKEKLEEIAVRDDLTGLFNRRHFLERLDEELARAGRGGGGVHVALIDLDHFKRVNDKHGHQVGDLVLRKFADVARRELRRSDVIARYGGEEFAFLIQGNAAIGATIDEQTRQLLGKLLLRKKSDGQVIDNITASFGVAQRNAGEYPEQLIERADKALYKAKEAGRNRVQMAA